MSIPDRAHQMVLRVRAAAERAGAGADARLVAAATELAIAPRAAALAEHDAALLHPGRSALILFEDAGERDPVTAAAAALVESLDTGLEVPADRIRDALGERVASARELVPTPEREGDLLLEALLAADDATRRAAVAERLDHARHLHLRQTGSWRDFLDGVKDVYLPVALRTDPVLGRRLEWWAGMFERRHIPRA